MASLLMRAGLKPVIAVPIGLSIDGIIIFVMYQIILGSK